MHTHTKTAAYSVERLCIIVRNGASVQTHVHKETALSLLHLTG